MKLTATLLIVFALLDSVAVAEWPLHQTFYGANGSPRQTFYDSRGRYIERATIYPPAFELHEANGFSRTLPYPPQRHPNSHGDAHRQRSEPHQSP
jgi:hypothetical protein